MYVTNDARVVFNSTVGTQITDLSGTSIGLVESSLIAKLSDIQKVIWIPVRLQNDGLSSALLTDWVV